VRNQGQTVPAAESIFVQDERLNEEFLKCGAQEREVIAPEIEMDDGMNGYAAISMAMGANESGEIQKEGEASAGSEMKMAELDEVHVEDSEIDIPKVEPIAEELIGLDIEAVAENIQRLEAKKAEATEVVHPKKEEEPDTLDWKDQPTAPQSTAKTQLAKDPIDRRVHEKKEQGTVPVNVKTFHESSAPQMNGEASDVPEMKVAELDAVQGAGSKSDVLEVGSFTEEINGSEAKKSEASEGATQKKGENDILDWINQSKASQSTSKMHLAKVSIERQVYEMKEQETVTVNGTTFDESSKSQTEGKASEGSEMREEERNAVQGKKDCLEDDILERFQNAGKHQGSKEMESELTTEVSPVFSPSQENSGEISKEQIQEYSEDAGTHFYFNNLVRMLVLNFARVVLMSLMGRFVSFLGFDRAMLVNMYLIFAWLFQERFGSLESSLPDTTKEILVFSVLGPVSFWYGLRGFK